jgi:hypothetical protein
VFTVSFLLFLLIRSIALVQTPGAPEVRWDAAWYGNIADFGYSTNGNREIEHNVVFFPLYPIVCWVVKNLLRVSTPVAMLLVSALSTAVSLTILHKVLLRQCTKGVARSAVALIGFSPYAVFLYNGYTEGLFLLLIAVFFYFLLNADSPTGAAIAVAFASAVRPYGCLLSFVLAFELLRRHYAAHGFTFTLDSRPFRQVFMLFPLCFAGLAAYTFWLGYKFNEPMAFSHNMRAWHLNPGGELDATNLITFGYAARAVVVGITTKFWPLLPGLLLFLLTPILLFRWRRTVHPTLLCFAVVMFLFFHGIGHTSPNKLFDIGRHLSVVFPLLMMVALTLSTKEVGRFLRLFIDDESPAARECMCWNFICAIPLFLVLITSALLFARNTYLFYAGTFIS